MKSIFVGIPDDDILLQARAVIKAVTQGRAGPQASARLAAAEYVLSKAYLPHLTDEQLLYEVRRRAAVHQCPVRGSAIIES